jgi:putative alpha-1,2-mannosidase
VIDPASGFARPRNADGTWKTPYGPEEPDHFKEGTGWQYTWLAPHDFRGLFDLVGSEEQGRNGDATVIERLDTFFSTALSDVPAVAEVQKTITAFGVVYAGNQYAPSNEHDLQAPYTYDYIGQPWKTQKIMRGFQALYRPTPDGLPGNDDLGSMSAWFVWSALGFFPEVPGAPLYVTGSPMFERAAIRPAGGDEIVVEAPGASIASKYIQSARLGDSSLDRPWFTHQDLLDAGSVSFGMGVTPNEGWGADPAAAPPSLSTHDLSAFGCPERKDGGPEQVATVLTYVGDRKAKGEQVTLAARLTTVEGQPIAGETIAFEIAGQTLTGLTDGDGVASTVATVPNHGRSQVVVSRFAGNESLFASEISATITWGGQR